MIKKELIQIILIGVSIHLFIVLYDRNKKMKEYSGYLKDVGLPENIVNRMTFKELQDSFIYLSEYKNNLTPETNSYLYNSIKQIQNKYKIFNL